MEILAKDLASLLEGEVIGEEDELIKNVATLEDAKRGDISFIENISSKIKLDSILKTSLATIILIEKKTFQYIRDNPPKDKTFVVVNYPIKQALVKLLNLFSYNNSSINSGIHPTCIKGEDVIIEEGVFVGANVVIKNRVRLKKGACIYPFVYIEDDVEVGEESIIYSFVFLRSKTKIGKRVIIHPGAVIGADGFGYVENEGAHIKIPQIGGVIIEDDVEIGANTTIDRATLGNTLIKKGTKIDNLVQIAHNVKIGENCIIVSQTGIAGSVTLGDNVILGGQVGVKEHINIGKATKIAAKSGVTKDLPPYGIYSGFPAKPHIKELRLQAAISKLIEKKMNFESKK